jgi:hypothetical protein
MTKGLIRRLTSATLPSSTPGGREKIVCIRLEYRDSVILARVQEMAEERATARMIDLVSTSSQSYVINEDLPNKEGVNVGEYP